MRHVHLEDRLFILLVRLGLDLLRQLDDGLEMRVVLLLLQQCQRKSDVASRSGITQIASIDRRVYESRYCKKHSLWGRVRRECPS